ncbi:MAG: hypothetical protein APR54_01850 [Candidatus Cloacimonas sp. SDB]|nr:MAG: hypothetical protein APR54_01850 [Candidatus Cloacimonas sp. SDB]
MTNDNFDSSLIKVISGLKNNKFSIEKMLDDVCEKLTVEDSIVKSILPEPNRRRRLQNDLEKLYSRYPDTKQRPLLFGIPIGVKDIFNVDGFATKAGSKLPESIFSGKEAVCVTSLKNAGALILGKTVTTEFAYYEPGPTRNPRNPQHTPGGSSSGSAAAVAANFCPLTLGTQTIGSIIRPAAYCGVVGVKPSSSRISNNGVFPFSPSVDQVGFFVKDTESALTAASILVDDWKVTDYCPREDIVLGIPEGSYLQQADQNVLSTFRNDIEKLKTGGVRIIQFKTLDNIKEINRLHQIIIAKEFAEVHWNLFKKYGELYSGIAVELMNEGMRVSENDLEKALSGRTEYRALLQKQMQELNLDFLITPAVSTFAPFGLNSTGSPIMNLPWTYYGLPVAVIPGSKIKHNLISGLQIIAPYGQDEFLLGNLTTLAKTWEVQ